ncbi:ABC transporter permease [Pelagibacterium limicola]|uniref:ABC transporter permease n=1 Tax=Pelagibacterium limicola TaxID=2791022 RepID=UPI0018AFAA7F|nr:iron ABC transporter permease [Pelagibacterium limicola]
MTLGPKGFVILLRIIAATAVICVFAMLAMLIIASFSPKSEFGAWTLANYIDMAGMRQLWPAIFNTLVVGIGTTTFLLMFALPFTWVLSRTDFASKGVLLTILTVSLALPAFVTAMAYVWLLNPNSGIFNRLLESAFGWSRVFNVYSLGWICFIQALMLTPAAVFMMLPAFRNFDSTLEEAASVSGISPRRAFFKIVLPTLAPAVGAVSIFFFILAVEIFDVVGVIGMPGNIDVITTLVYQSTYTVYGPPDYGFAATLGMPLLALCAIGVLIYLWLLRRADRYSMLSGKNRAPILRDLGRWRFAVWGLIGTWGTLAVVLPLLTVIWTSLTPYLQPPSMAALSQLSFSSYRGAAGLVWAPFVNTILLVIGTIVFSIVWSVSVSWLATRVRSKIDKALDAIVFLSLAVPGMLAAVAMQFLALSAYHWVPLLGTLWLIIITMAIRSLAFTTRTLNSSALQIHSSLEEAAYVSGVGRMRTFLRIFLPVIKPAIMFAVLVTTLISARELTIPLMLYSPRSSVISTTIFDLQATGRYDEAAVFSLLIIAILLVLALASRRRTAPIA